MCVNLFGFAKVFISDSEPSIHIYIYIYIYVGCKVWICAIHGLRCAGSVLRATIHGFRVQSMDRVYLGRKVQIRGQSLYCAAQTTDCLVRSQVQFKDKLQVSGVALAS